MTEHTAQSKKYAVLLNAGPANVGAAVNGLNYALRLHDAGHEVRVYLDGAATRWPGELAVRLDHPVREYFSALVDCGLVAGACGFCASAFDARDACDAAGVTLLGDDGEHGPDLGTLVAEGYRLLTVG